MNAGDGYVPAFPLAKSLEEEFPRSILIDDADTDAKNVNALDFHE